MTRLDGKVALITGGARGMGAAEARRFAAEGANVVITDVLVEDGTQTAKEIGDAAVFHRHDVSSSDDWAAVTAATIERFGKIDVLVNNAGIFWLKSIADTSEEDFVHMTNINQLGVFLGMKHVGPHMVAAGSGSIINISSIAGLRGSANSISYTASKFAVRGMTKVAALEWATTGVRVNSIHPGLIDTPMADVFTGGADEFKGVLGSRVPMGHLAQADEVANMALFLASDEASHCTGGEYVVDGGITAGMLG